MGRERDPAILLPALDPVEGGQRAEDVADLIGLAALVVDADAGRPPLPAVSGARDERAVHEVFGVHQRHEDVVLLPLAVVAEREVRILAPGMGEVRRGDLGPALVLAGEQGHVGADVCDRRGP